MTEELTEQSVLEFLKQHPNKTVFEMRDEMPIKEEDFPEKLNRILDSCSKVASGLYHYGNCKEGHGDGGPHGYERRYRVIE